MKIIVVGTGFVGLPHAAVLSERVTKSMRTTLTPIKLPPIRAAMPNKSSVMSMSPGCLPPLTTLSTATCSLPQTSAKFAKKQMSFICASTPHPTEMVQLI